MYINKPATMADIQSALSCISPDCDRDQWSRIGMSLKSELGEEGFELFEAWSQRAENFSKQDCRDTWKSIKGSGSVKIGTLFYLAKQNGWKSANNQPTKEEIEQREKYFKQKKEREAKEKEKQLVGWGKAKKTAIDMWAKASSVDNHPYLSKKKIESFGLKALGDLLLVPMNDPLTGDLWNIQSIYPKPTLIRGSKKERDKDFLPGGKKAGLCFVIGKSERDNSIYIAEGMATAASVHEAMNSCVYVAFDSGNLKSVALSVRKKFPKEKIILVADNDAATKNNPGVTKAREAAKLIKGLIFVPHFSKDILSKVPAGKKLSDFNDLCNAAGKDEAKKQILSFLTSKLPSGFFINGNMLYFEDADNSRGSIWVSSKIEITAVTRDDKSKEWGRLIRFHDMDGHEHTWAMPMSMLAGDGGELRRILLDAGLRISSNTRARNLLSEYLQACEPKNRARCVSRTGWYKNVYVLPNEVIGELEGEAVYLQTNGGEISGYGTKGSLQAWRNDIGVKCIGNHRLVLAVSIAFAPILLELLGESESFGIHFRGSSSIGKTTMLTLAASVWGGSDRVRTYKATDNALESVAQMHNDSLLCLDELKQLDPKVAGSVVYMISQGTGKARADRSGYGRNLAKWRTIYLSTGEISIEQHIKDGGGQYHAGQDVRAIDIQADAGKNLGVYDELHGLSSGSELSQYFAQAVKRNYGEPSREFIKMVIGDIEGTKQTVKALSDKFNASVVPSGSDGQVSRVSRKFSFIAAAGELATLFGITGWEPGEATQSATVCFNSWVTSRGGTGKKEISDVIRQVKHFIQKNSDARFVDMSPNNNNGGYHVQDRAGYRGTSSSGEYLYYIFKETFEDEVTKGMDSRFAIKVLKECGFLYTNEKNRSTTKIPITTCEGNRPRTYAIKSSILESE